MTDDQDRYTSIFSACADIQRWLLVAVMTGKLSNDRKKDILRAAAHITRLIQEL